VAETDHQTAAEKQSHPLTSFITALK